MPSPTTHFMGQAREWDPAGSPSRVLSVPAWKRCQDVVLILLVAPFLAPLMCLMALVIKVLSRGPVLFRQDRIGLGGQPFQLLKFRTMEVNADCSPHSDHLDKLMESGAPMTKLDLEDGRLIPGGRWLRASALDELPQLFNVLRGTMSLVGPRPCTPYEFSRYRDSQKRRFDVLPGLTGLWQVSGKNRLSFAEMVELDERYAEEANWLLDLKILLLTPKAIITQVLDTVRRRKASGGESDPTPPSDTNPEER